MAHEQLEWKSGFDVTEVRYDAQAKHFTWRGKILLDGWGKPLTEYEDYATVRDNGTLLVKDEATGYAYNPRFVKPIYWDQEKGDLLKAQLDLLLRVVKYYGHI